MTNPVVNKAKEVATKVKDTVKGSDKTEKIENDVLDDNPPGSASIQDRGVPSRAANENRSSVKTATPVSSASDEDDDKDAQVVISKPYKKTSPIAAARKSAIGKLSGVEVDNRNKIRSAGKDKSEGTSISPTVLARMMRGMNNAPANERYEFDNFIKGLKLHPDTLREIQELASHPEIFVGDQRPANLQVLGLPPGAEKPPEFEVAPGTTAKYDARYFPTRYAMPPRDEDFEDGDIVYSVHEDATFTVLSVAQQTPEWQASHHTPPMNLIRRIGGEVSDLPKAVTESGILKESEEEEKN